MKILFLHGWRSVPGGVKPTYLQDHGHTVINPQLPDDDFDEALRIAQTEFDKHQPQVVVGSSRGGAVAMNLQAGDSRLVLLCPAWKKWGSARTVKPGTIILHSRADDVVPFAHSEELIRNSELPLESLIDVGCDHRLADLEALEAMLDACEASTELGALSQIQLFEIGIDGTCAMALPQSEFVRSLCDATAQNYKRTAFQRPWVGYLAVAENQFIGACGFKTSPQDGRVEIAYGTLPEFEGMGVATQMARQLIQIARDADPSLMVFAQTLPEENASVSILRKLGFTRIGTVYHPEDGNVWEWHLINYKGD